jgi:hypothetical protein
MVMEAIHIGRHSKMQGDVIFEDLATWEQRFRCLECGKLNVWLPVGVWVRCCGCLGKLMEGCRDEGFTEERDH